MKWLLLLIALLVASSANAEDDYVKQYRTDLTAHGATPEQLALFDALYVTSRRPTLVCFCHHDANVTTCGVNGRRYLNECSARCAHVNSACVGSRCGDCAQYFTTDPVALEYSPSYKGTVYKDGTPSGGAKHIGRKLLFD